LDSGARPTAAGRPISPAMRANPPAWKSNPHAPARSLAATWCTLPAVFTDDELATLREHGIAIFHGKVILKAQPPISDAQLAEVEARLTGPVPEGLRELWRTAFGGSLDYDLEITFGEHRYTTSFRELFYPESGAYRRLGNSNRDLAGRGV
jgi:hypothetical protein